MIPPIEYPVELRDVVVVGRLSRTARTLSVRPLLHGDFELFVWPQRFPEARWVLRHALAFATEDDPPAIVVFELRDQPRFLQDVLEWEWSLVRRSAADGVIEASAALFGPRPVARGLLRLAEPGPGDTVRTLVWTCHQPFETIHERAAVDPESLAGLRALRRIADELEPHAVWGLGDTAYSDGTESTDFSSRVYDNDGWHLDPETRRSVRTAYRRMYRHHWSFDDLQHVYRNYPHLLMWDDHEIHDGFGSETADRATDGNLALFQIAREVAEEYVLDVGPRLRAEGDAHKAYVSGPQACFLFDSRTSRNYADPGGRIVSTQQLEDFQRFADAVVEAPEVSLVLLGTAVPFLYLEDVYEALGATLPRAVTNVFVSPRDDLRDSWHSPGNREALREVLAIVRGMLLRRPGLHVVNVSGDVHVANAFELLPPGFPRPIYQVTTSALSNRSHLPPLASEVMEIGAFTFMSELGLVRRLWPEIFDPNVLCIEASPHQTTLSLRVTPVDGSTATDQQIVLD